MIERKRERERERERERNRKRWFIRFHRQSRSDQIFLFFPLFCSVLVFLPTLPSSAEIIKFDVWNQNKPFPFQFPSHRFCSHFYKKTKHRPIDLLSTFFLSTLFSLSRWFRSSESVRSFWRERWKWSWQETEALKHRQRKKEAAGWKKMKQDCILSPKEF